MTLLVWSPWFSNSFLRILDDVSNALNVYKFAGGGGVFNWQIGKYWIWGMLKKISRQIPNSSAP